MLKRRPYLKLSNKTRSQVGKYTSENEVSEYNFTQLGDVHKNKSGKKCDCTMRLEFPKYFPISTIATVYVKGAEMYMHMYKFRCQLKAV